MNDKEFPLKSVFLTFDDGPSKPYTIQILDILKEFQTTASFFVCGKNVRRYPEVTQRIVKDRHAIGNHTYSHSRILSYMQFLTTSFLIREIEKTSSIIQAITGVKTNFFRPPWGIATSRLSKDLEANGYKTVLWDIEASDWQRPQAGIIEKRILKKIKPNSIILLHDGHETRLRCDRSQTVLALPSLIKKIKERGYVFRKLEVDT